LAHGGICAREDHGLGQDAPERRHHVHSLDRERLDARQNRVSRFFDRQHVVTLLHALIRRGREGEVLPAPW